MANFVWPDYVAPSSFGLFRYTKTFVGSSMFGRSSQTVNSLSDRWKAAMVVPIKSKEHGSKVEAFLNRLRGGANTVSLWHFAREVPQGSLQGTTTLAATASKGSDFVMLNVANSGLDLLSGDMLEIQGRLYQCALDTTVTGSNLTVPLVGQVSKDLPTGTAVNLQRASGIFRLTSKISPTYGPSGHLMAQTLEFVEVIQND